MPVYEYLCEECGKEFEVVMRISEHDEADVRCEKCGSAKVRQRFSSFFAKTSKKS